MRSRFRGADPIGQRLRVGGSPADPPYTIVGVVGDEAAIAGAQRRQRGTTRRATAAGSTTCNRSSSRARGDTTALAAAIRQAVWSVDKDQPIVRVATMETLVAASEAERRFA
jgi:putative ABC transport system permease protein